MAEIIPAILPKDYDELVEKMSAVRRLVPLVQIDVCDGAFVKARTWPFHGSGPDIHFLDIIKEEEAFPFWDEVEFEADLMVNAPRKYIDEWITAGASRLVIHAESTHEFEQIAKDVDEKYMRARDSMLGVELGIALNIDTPTQTIFPYVEKADFVQFMGIDSIGAQGQEFDEKVVEKISDFRKKYPDMTVSVDGGVNLDNAGALIEAGASRLVIGSAIFGSDDIAGTIEEFKAVSSEQEEVDSQ